MKRLKHAALIGISLLWAAVAAAQDWQRLDPAQVLVIDSSAGTIYVEMRPDMASLAVARIKQLAREGVYDGLQFHRVIAGFVAQTGNPNNRDGGVSKHPDLAPEFVFKMRPDGGALIAGQSSDAVRGLLGSVPFEGVPAASARAWGAYCTGVAGMGRQDDKNSANSEIFFMLAPARRLDRDYTVWGRVVVGLDVLQRLAVGEPPKTPDVMRRVRVLSDLADAGSVWIASDAQLRQRIAQTRASKGADFSVCDLEVPARYEAKPAARGDLR